ncbi:MAG TPA: hypothetical protein VFB81_14255 [Myxococcales bacterium]|nr:hypothetical protein [Myxococcales bacterium]
MIAQLLLATALGISVQDHLDGAEIGDANLTIAFESGGKYRAETEGAKEKTVARGTWAVQGEVLEVKVSSCKGPACDKLGKGYKAGVSMVSDRAMTVRTSAPDSPLGSGSYYCHYGACEKRVGVMLVTHSAKAPVMKYLLDFLIDKNVGRGGSGTVVWWGKRMPDKAPGTELTYCTRDEDHSKKGAELVARDLAELAWLGVPAPKASATKDCLYDVQLVVKDDAELPAKR